MNQLRFTWATKRRIQGPNSTPLVSNWISGPNCPPPPLWFSKASPCVYRCRLRSASPSDPPAVGDRPLIPFCGDGVRFDGNCIADCDSGSFVASDC
jgi:hypothetical protein